MCFTIPAKVIKIEKNHVIIEGGKKILAEKNLNVKLGEYIQIAGNMAVGKLSAKEGLTIRKLIKSLQ